jgi:hypothetical protein
LGLLPIICTGCCIRSPALPAYSPPRPQWHSIQLRQSARSRAIVHDRASFKLACAEVPRQCQTPNFPAPAAPWTPVPVQVPGRNGKVPGGFPILDCGTGHRDSESVGFPDYLTSWLGSTSRALIFNWLLILPCPLSPSHTPCRRHHPYPSRGPVLGSFETAEILSLRRPGGGHSAATGTADFKFFQVFFGQTRNLRSQAAFQVRRTSS